MPDTPVIVDGNAQKFTITLPKGNGKLAVDPNDGKRTLAVDAPEDQALQLRFNAGTAGATEEIVPLGLKWTVTIEEVP